MVVRKKMDSLYPTESSDASAESEQDLIQKELLIAIQQLPKGKQDIIRLFYAESYSIMEISAFLHIPLGTVKSRLFKAREKLKSILKKKSGKITWKKLTN